jgi:hypothetical protein
MHAWVWPRQLSFVIISFVFFLQVFFPIKPDHFLIDSQYSWMEMNWGTAIASSVMRGTVTLFGIFPHTNYFYEERLFSWLIRWYQDSLFQNMAFLFWLKVTALGIWLGCMVAMMSLSHFVLRIVFARSLLLVESSQRAELQPWNRAQRWPIWRRSLGLIPLLTLCWGYLGALAFAPFFAGLWAGLAYQLWWPFLQFRKA